MILTQRPLLLLLLMLLPLKLVAKDEKQKKLSRKEKQELEWFGIAEDFLIEAKADSLTYSPIDKAGVDTAFRKNGTNINFNEEFANKTLRKNDVDYIKQELLERLDLKERKLTITVDNLPLDQYVPVYYGASNTEEKTSTAYVGIPNVRNLSSPNTPHLGLNNRHIALWNSHGRYYNSEDKIWKWQRAPLFSTVEDLFTSAYILPFLLPMLENAGANVYLPRERDIQVNEIIVDNADADFWATGNTTIHSQKGFKNHLLLNKPDLNPFAEGDHTALSNAATATWSLNVPESGEYAVYVSYISYPESNQEAEYTLYHEGGITDFLVNQTMGGGMWIYLGHFFFTKEKEAKLTLQGKGELITTADAVKVGGGMGDIPRDNITSGVPRWQEAARYYLQYSGALDTITFNLHGDTIDYNDDFRSRARWVNYLKGGNAIEPWLVNNAQVDGFNIPIDLAMGIHSDAGHHLSMDTLVGTLSIYSTYDVEDNRHYRTGQSRLSGRDFADIVQTQLVNDLRYLHNEEWPKRELWDKMYSEATFADVPSLLFELHSHSNAQDMRYGLDPQFRFDTSRALYKGILRFLSSYYNKEYIVQPLPVTDMAITTEGGHHYLSWEPTNDPIEESAIPDAFIVYTRKGNAGWNNGEIVYDNAYNINTYSKDVYSYKVTAINAGGESLPSTILATASISNSAKTILVVDGFTRVSAPAFIESGDSVGLAPWVDEGVAWGTDIATIGAQYLYDQKKLWKSDEDPGHGASYKELSSTLFLGNNFDHSLAYASAIADAGYNATSCSMAALKHGKIELNKYDAILFAFGEQRTTTSPTGKSQYGIYSPEMMIPIVRYCQQEGARIGFLGAHLAKETLVDRSGKSKLFAEQILGFSYNGEMGDTHNFIFRNGDTVFFRYNVDHTQDYYRLEHADILNASDSANVLFTFIQREEAVIAYQQKHRAVSSSIPLECILNKEDQFHFMALYLEALFNDSPKNTSITDE